MWVRDFKDEDEARLALWQQRGAGPLGMPSKPEPWGIVTASLDHAVSMTARCLDGQPEVQSDDE